MITGRFNIVLGLVAMILAAITGFALGLTRDAYFGERACPTTACS